MIQIKDSFGTYPLCVFGYLCHWVAPLFCHALPQSVQFGKVYTFLGQYTDVDIGAVLETGYGTFIAWPHICLTSHCRHGIHYILIPQKPVSFNRRPLRELPHFPIPTYV